MPITISGSTGIAGVDGSASTPAVQGTDTNTGIAFPAADTVAVATGGTERMRIDSAGNIGIGTTSPVYSIQLNGASKNFGITGTGNPNFEVVSSDANGIPFWGMTNGTRNWTWRIEGSSGALTARDNTAVAERLRIDTSGNLYFNSGYGSAAVAYGCRAWVNFNGTTNTGGFCTIRASGNVTSVADNGTGDYTVNFTTAMPDANYAVVALGMASLVDNSTLRGIEQRGNLAAGSARVLCINGLNAITYDADYVNVVVFR